jgi:hypothetical protein
MLLWGILSEVLFAAALIYEPHLQKVFATEPLGPAELSILACFPFIVWGADEVRRSVIRERTGGRAATDA